MSDEDDIPRDDPDFMKPKPSAERELRDLARRPPRSDAERREKLRSVTNRLKARFG